MEITSEEIALHIDKAKKGKQGAFKFLLDHFWNEVFGFQMKRVRNEHEAEDITIETFAKALTKLRLWTKSIPFQRGLLPFQKTSK